MRPRRAKPQRHAGVWVHPAGGVWAVRRGEAIDLWRRADDETKALNLWVFPLLPEGEDGPDGST